MQAVLRGVIVYMALLVLFRFAGKRTLAQTTPFEFVLLLILSETIQQAIVHDDNSMTTGLLLVLTLVSLSIAMSLLKQKSPWLDKWLDGQPLVIFENGELNRERMDKSRVDKNDIMEAARMAQGIERLDQLAYVVVERSGQISVIAGQNEVEGNDQGGSPPQPQP